MRIEYYKYINRSKKEEQKEILFLYNYNIIKKYFIFDREFTHYFFLIASKKDK